jgi:hypothetical protein
MCRTKASGGSARFAAKEGIVDGELKIIVNDVLEEGQAEANLGGGVCKVRVARPDEGKSGGYRVIVYFKNGERTFYVYGFAKSNRGNISQKELRNHKEAAKVLLALANEQLDRLIKDGDFIEV